MAGGTELRIAGSGCVGPRDGRRGAGPSTSTSATRARCCGSSRAGSPGRAAERGRSTATSRSAAGRSTGSPSRCARWAPRSSAATAACRRCASRAATLRGIEYRLPVASAQVEVVPAARRPARRGRDPRDRAGADPRPHRAHAARGRRRGRVTELRTRAGGQAARPGGSPSRPVERLEPGRISVPGDFSSARLPRRRRGDRARKRGAARGGRASTRPGSACWGSSTGWAPRSRSRRTRDDGGRAARGDRRPPRPARRRRASTPRRCRWRSTSCRWWRCWAASPRAGPSSPGAEELRHKESDRIATRGRGAARDRRRDRGDRRRLRRRAAPAAFAAARSTPAATTAWRCSGAVAGPRLARGRRGRGHGRGRGQLPALRGGPGLAARQRRPSALARVALAGPGGEQQQQARVLGRADLAALVGVELRQQSRPAADRSPPARRSRSRPRRPAARRARGPGAPAGCSPAGSSITIARPSSSESSTSGCAAARPASRCPSSASLSDRFLVRLRARRATLSSAAMVIAIDGPAGAGKSTVARALAERLGLTYLDSGAMYRCVALAALRAGADLDDGGGAGTARPRPRDRARRRPASCSTARTSARRSARPRSRPRPRGSRCTPRSARRWSSASGR